MDCCGLRPWDPHFCLHFVYATYFEIEVVCSLSLFKNACCPFVCFVVSFFVYLFIDLYFCPSNSLFLPITGLMKTLHYRPLRLLSHPYYGRSINSTICWKDECVFLPAKFHSATGKIQYTHFSTKATADDESAATLCRWIFFLNNSLNSNTKLTNASHCLE